MERHFSKRPLSTRILSWVIIIAISVSLILIFGGIIFSTVVEKRAAIEFKKINGAFSSLKIDLLTRSITVQNLNWQANHTLYPHTIVLKFVRLQGISPFQLFYNHKIQASELLLDSGIVSYNSVPVIDSIKVPLAKSYGVEIQHITIRNVKTIVKSDSLLKMEAILSTSFGPINITSPDNTVASLKSSLQYLNGSAKQLLIKKDGGFYTIRVARLNFNSQTQTIAIDSFVLIPNYGKYEFANELGEQTDRVDLGIDKIAVTGLNFAGLLDSTISIHKISVHTAILHVFRDKRIPDRNKSIIEMPMTALKKLPFGIRIDSIAIDNSKITVEELSPGGFRPGYINFQELSAVMAGLSNRYKIKTPKYAQLTASAKIMGSGQINAAFLFPLDESPTYLASGVVSALHLRNLNSILENTVQIRIESGMLNELRFNFNYTDINSKGGIEIKYEDLNMTRLNFDSRKSTNFLKTLLLNAFVKNSKDKSTSRAKRIGVIDVQRDPHHFIFNYWWKSLQSGLKYSVLGKPDQPSPSVQSRARVKK